MGDEEVAKFRRFLGMPTLLLLLAWLAVKCNAQLSGGYNDPRSLATLSARVDDVFRMHYFMRHGLKFDKRGYFRISPNITVVNIDIGTNRDSEFADLTKYEHNRLGFGFEPHPKVYSEFKTKSPRFFLFNAAAAPLTGFLPFTLSEFDECNSLRTTNTDLYDKYKSQYGAAAMQTRCMHSLNKTIQVLAFPVSEVIKRLPPHLLVDFIKIDAQGYDLQVAQSIAPYFHRVKRLMLECQDVSDKSRLLYHGAATCSEQRAWFLARGLIQMSCHPNNYAVGEQNCVYLSRTLGT